MSAQFSSYLCMTTRAGNVLLFHLNTNVPSDAINQLIINMPDYDFISGFYLDEEIHKEIISDFKSDWDSYNRSLQGICYHPRFPENFESIKRNSKFIYSDIRWVHIGWKKNLSTNSVIKDCNIDEHHISG